MPMNEIAEIIEKMQSLSDKISNLEKRVLDLECTEEPAIKIHATANREVPEKIKKLARTKINRPLPVKKEPKPIRADKFNQ